MLTALGIPSIPGLACPAAAGALGVAGLGPICQAAGGVAGAAATQVAGFGVSSILDAISGWVSAGGVWLLGQIESSLSQGGNFEGVRARQISPPSRGATV